MLSISRVVAGHKPVIAVVTIENPTHVLPLANALAKGGVSILEITLRSKYGLDAIKKVREDMPSLCVGAGTVTKPDQFEMVKKSGGKFAVSPGLTPALIDAASDQQIPYLPGAVTPSEVLIGIENGLQYLKLFPAESSGGIDSLKNLNGPFPEIMFCPTGGINDTNIRQYLSADNVFCVGTSWLTPKQLVQEENWGEITRRASILTKDLKNIE